MSEIRHNEGRVKLTQTARRNAWGICWDAYENEEDGLGVAHNERYKEVINDLENNGKLQYGEKAQHKLVGAASITTHSARILLALTESVKKYVGDDESEENRVVREEVRASLL